MTIDALVAPLLQQRIFHGLKPIQITEIVRHAERVIIKAGQAIVKEGEPGAAAILIVSGEAERQPDPQSDCSPEPIIPGTLIGELAMLIEKVHTTTIVAKSDVRALRITRESLHQQMREDPVLADHMSTRISERLESLVQDLLRIADELSESDTTDASPSDDSANLPSPVAEQAETSGPATGASQ